MHVFFFLLSAVDLLEKMLDLDSDKRLTAEQALGHSYLATYADPEDEVIMTGISLTSLVVVCLDWRLSPADFNSDLSLVELKS